MNLRSIQSHINKCNALSQTYRIKAQISTRNVVNIRNLPITLSKKISRSIFGLFSLSLSAKNELNSQFLSENAWMRWNVNSILCEISFGKHRFCRFEKFGSKLECLGPFNIFIFYASIIWYSVKFHTVCVILCHLCVEHKWAANHSAYKLQNRKFKWSRHQEKQKNYSIAFAKSRIRLVNEMFWQDTKFIYMGIEFIQR